MLSRPTIPKRTNRPLELDYQQLYAIGLQHIQRLSSRIWTDYNIHDPGITTLELLCYALTDLSYRASFPIEDLLASETNNREAMQQQFFTARQIFPNRALTKLDYRKLLIDLPGVKNAWIEPATQVYYVDPLKEELLGTATLFETDLINLPLLATRLKQAPANSVSKYLFNQLRDETRRELATYDGVDPEAESLRIPLVQDLNRIIQGNVFYKADWLSGLTISPETQFLIEQYQQATNKQQTVETISDRLNRFFLEDVYPTAIARHHRLRATVSLNNIRKIHLAGLYEVIIDYMDDITNNSAEKATVKQSVKQRLHSNRNLCEDFVRIQEVESQFFVLCTELELAPDADVSQVKAELLFQVQQYLAPPVRNYTLSEMLARKNADGTPYYTTDEIFDGPILDCGFIDDAELQKAELPTAIYLSDVISIVMDIPGVRAVRDMVINPEGTETSLENKWVVPVVSGKKALLNRGRSRLVFYKRNMPVVADETKVSQHYDKLAADAKKLVETSVAYDLEIPLGNYRQSDRYYSFQNHFPAVYGLSEVGLSSAADNRRKALAYQLKAYLLFFDQIMANYFAQLSQVKQLFSTDANLHRTYFFQVVDSFANYDQIYSQNNGIATLQTHSDEQEREQRLNRRQRFLDHLIARFAERFHEFADIMYSAFGVSAESMVAAKCEFLQDYPTISSERAIAYNYTLPNSSDVWDTADNVSGLEKRLAKLLNIPNYRRQDLNQISYTVYPDAGKFRFRIQVKASGEVILLSSAAYDTQQQAIAAMKRALPFAALRENYRNRPPNNGNFRFSVINDADQEVLQSAKELSTDAERDREIDVVMRYLNVEGMYLIEPILLRPEQNSDPLLPIRLDPTCTDCANNDPYSYRIQIILPAYGSRFSNMEFRRFAEQVIREEIPAHILPKICWISRDDMTLVETQYRDWLELKAGAKTTSRTNKLTQFIQTLLTVRNVYPVGNLRECDSAEEQAKFVLGQTALGTENLNPS